jgi:hypothetical protein
MPFIKKCTEDKLQAAAAAGEEERGKEEAPFVSSHSVAASFSMKPKELLSCEVKEAAGEKAKKDKVEDEEGGKKEMGRNVDFFKNKPPEARPSGPPLLLVRRASTFPGDNSGRRDRGGGGTKGKKANNASPQPWMGPRFSLLGRRLASEDALVQRTIRRLPAPVVASLAAQLSQAVAVKGHHRQRQRNDEDDDALPPLPVVKHGRRRGRRKTSASAAAMTTTSVVKHQTGAGRMWTIDAGHGGCIQ